MSLVIPQSPTPFLLGGPLPNAHGVRVQGINLAIGDTDLYTCPAGRRAWIRGMYYNNLSPASGTVAFFPEVKISGTYYRLRSSNSVTTGTGILSVTLPSTFICEAGDILAINAATTAGGNVTITVVEFDNTAPLKTSRLIGLTSGNNTLYTAPSGRSAIFGEASNVIPVLGGGTGGPTFVSDFTSRNLYVNAVPNGGSPAASNQLMISSPFSSGVASNMQCACSLSSGDFINVNIDVGNAAQFFWWTGLELAG